MLKGTDPHVCKYKLFVCRKIIFEGVIKGIEVIHALCKGWRLSGIVAFKSWSTAWDFKLSGCFIDHLAYPF